MAWQKAKRYRAASSEKGSGGDRDLPHELTAKMSSYIIGLFAAMIFNTVPIYSAEKPRAKSEGPISPLLRPTI